ncbi:uncharacterized protein LOC124634675 [Helicoverpa zea]|uniref:uncharacterized protein LOC124634675 n=1 Tax=Helicoverpa zea TaxID=7113 RepID=UPI001F5A42DD|nr:uncharacterized protein LOC124634675 [Helicoverpa zea]
MPKKLTYFNINGLAEPIRYILHYTKQDFEDNRIELGNWPDLKLKEKLPFGQLPVYEEDGRVLCQSLAIAKYVARGTDLIPSDPWKYAQVESAVYSVLDYWKNVTPVIQEKDQAKQKEMVEKLHTETIEYYFSRFNNLLKENGGYFSGKLSWGEFILLGIVEAGNLFLGTNVEKKYPAVDALVKEIRNLPGVKEYIVARGPYDFEEIKARMNKQVKMPRRLQYFDFNGLGEKIRYLLHYTGQEFEDVRHDVTIWPVPEIKETLPFGQFPVYEEDGKVLCQSLAIARYVARGTDLIPSDPWKNAQVDSAVYSIMDYNKNVIAAVHEPDPQKKVELRNKLFNEHIDYYFSRFEKLLKENGGYFSGKLSWGEFVLCTTVDSTNFFFTMEVEKNYPAIKAVCEEIWNAPGVKEYIAARGPYNLDCIKKRFG